MIVDLLKSLASVVGKQYSKLSTRRKNREQLRTLKAKLAGFALMASLSTNDYDSAFLRWVADHLGEASGIDDYKDLEMIIRLVADEQNRMEELLKPIVDKKNITRLFPQVTLPSLTVANLSRFDSALFTEIEANVNVVNAQSTRLEQFHQMTFSTQEINRLALMDNIQTCYKGIKDQSYLAVNKISSMDLLK